MEKGKLIKLIEDTFQIFSKEPQLIICDSKEALIIKDTHGDLDTTLNPIKLAEKKGLNLPFLGDYVDRGRSSWRT